MTSADLLSFCKRQNLPIPPELTDNQLRVLIVDDEPGVTEWLAEEIRLEYPDCRVLQAHDGFAAGELVASERPSVIILDLRMPGMDGYEVCRRIKSRPETAQAKVIAITAYPSEESEQRILEQGADICLTKPFDIQDLLGELKKVIRQ